MQSKASGAILYGIPNESEVYLESSQTSMREQFCENNGFLFSQKSSIIGVWVGSMNRTLHLILFRRTLFM